MAVSLAVAGVAASDNPADERFVFEPRPEAPDAGKLGAAQVEAAQKLAKQKQFADAAAALEKVSLRLPASLHDCNLALAYLRASALTRAQLAWDLSGLRNGARPRWCTGEVATQLSEALRAAKYVPVTIDVSPPDALVEVAGIAMRSMRTVWLPGGPVVITASAPGLETQTLNASVTAPSTRVALTLSPPKPVETPDAGVTPDASVTTEVVRPPPISNPGGVHVSEPDEPQETPRAPAPGQPSALPRYASLTIAIAGWVGAGVFGYLTYSAKQDANERYPTDPEFGTLHDRYSRDSKLTLGAGILGALATGVFVYLVATDHHDDTPVRKVDIGVTGSSIGITYGGTFGGAR